MDRDISCPKCNSRNVVYREKMQTYFCEDCSEEFKPGLDKRRIFISYGRDDHADLAVRIKNDLQERGYGVWFDLERIKSGGDWEKYIEDGLQWVAESPLKGRIVLLMTPHAVRRPDGFCLNEVARAIQLGLTIIPVMVAWCEPPLSICRIQWLDMQDCVPLSEKLTPYNVKLARLIETLEDDKQYYTSVQSRLVSLLNPLPFDADVTGHISGFIGREWVFKRIDAWLREENALRIFWIVGPPGIGKTSIASRLCNKYREVGAFHFCRFGHLQRTDPIRFVLSIAYQLSTQLPEYQERLNRLKLEQIVHNSDARTIFDFLIIQPLSGNFPHPDRTILIVVDALDEASRDNNNELAELIAMEFSKTPDWLRLVVTSRNDQEVAHLFQGFKPFILDASTPENKSDIYRYLERELAKYIEKGEASSPAIDAIIARSEGNFLYAERVNQELAHGNLTLEKIEDFPQGLGGVYVQYFKRQFSDIGAYKKIIRPLLEALTVAQEPLATAFIASLFNWNDYESEELFSSLGSLFTLVDGTIKPFHRSLTDWVTNKNRAGPYYVSVREGHRRLAELGLQAYKKDAAGLSRYMLAYLPFHMIHLGLWDELKIVLTDQVFFDLSWNISQHNIKSYWTQIEAHSPLRAVDVYRGIIDEPSGYKDYFVWKIAILLADMGYFRESEALYNYLIGHYRRSGDFANLQACLGNLSILMQKSGHIENPADIQANFICSPDDKTALIATLNGQAFNRFMAGDLDLAMDLFREVERMCRDTGDKYELSVCLNNQSRIYYIRGNFATSMKMLKDIEDICREVNNYNGLSISLNNQALLLYESGDLDMAMGQLKESERISREQNNKNSLLISLNNQANILYDRGSLDEAMGLYKEMEKLCLELNNRNGLQVSFGNQAIILNDRGAIEGSLKLHREEERICRELGDKVGLEASMNAQAVIMYETGNFEGAVKLFKESEALCRTLGHKVGLQNSLGNQALVLDDMGDPEGAMKLHKEEEAICRELGNKYILQVSRCNQANILYMSGRRDEAMALFSEAGKEFQRSKNIMGEHLYLNCMALALGDKGDLNGAMGLLKDAEDICRRIGYKKGLQATLCNEAAFLYDLGETDRSLELLKEAERICHEIECREGLAISLMGRAIIDMFIYNKPTEALSMAKEACGIAENCTIRSLAELMGNFYKLMEEKTQGQISIATNGAGKVQTISGHPGLIRWPVKKTKQEKK
jgi:ATP/maltotriose-dependent transcriptional regulator MalT